MAASLTNLAGVYQAQGNYAEAESLYQQALAIAKKTLGPDHPKVATVLEKMARFYKKAGKQEEAEKFEEQAKAIRTKPQ